MIMNPAELEDCPATWMFQELQRRLDVEYRSRNSQLDGTIATFTSLHLIGEELPTVPEPKAKPKASASKPAFVVSSNGKPKRSQEEGAGAGNRAAGRRLEKIDGALHVGDVDMV